MFGQPEQVGRINTNFNHLKGIKMESKNNGRGRPKSDDPKIHLPNVTVAESTINAVKKISDEFPGMSLSDHYQKALDFYVNQYQSGITRLGFAKQE